MSFVMLGQIATWTISGTREIMSIQKSGCMKKVYRKPAGQDIIRRRISNAKHMKKMTVAYQYSWDSSTHVTEVSTMYAKHEDVVRMSMNTLTMVDAGVPNMGPFRVIKR